jgi:WD40 repeat protein
LRRVTLPAAQLKGFHWLADGRGVAVLKLAPDDYYIWDFADEAAAPPPPRPNPQFNSYKPGDLLAVAVSPDGRWLATGRISGTSEPQPIELLELAVNQPLTALKSRVAGNQPGHGYKLVFSPDSSVLYAMSRSQEPNRQGAPIAGPGPGAPLTMGKQSDQARVGVYDVTSGQERASFEVTAPTGGSLVFPSGPATVALTADNRMIVTGHADGIVRLWDAATGEERRSWKTFEPTDPSKLTNAAVVGLALVGNQALVTVDGLGEQRRWDLTTGREIGKAMANRTSVQAMALSPDGKSVVAGGSAGTIYFWDIAAGVERPPAPGHSNSIDQLFISADSRTVQTASWDRTIRTWDLASGREQRCVALDGRGFPTAFTRDGRGLIGRTAWSNLGPPAPYDKFTWDTDTGKRHAVAGELADPRFWVLNAPNDGSLLVTDQQDQSVFLREWPSGQVRRKFPPPMLGPPATSYQTTAAVACADGQMVAVLGEDRWVMQHDHGWVSLFDAATGRVRFRQSTPDAHPRVAAVLADRAGVIVGGRTWVPATPVGEPRPLYKPQEALVLLDADSGELVRSFLPAKFRPDGFRSIMALAVSPDSRQLAAAEADFSVWVYEIATGRVRHHLAGHTNEVTALAFTPDGRRLVSTSRDLTGLVWDVSLAAADKAGSAPQATDVDRLWTDLAKRDWKDSGPSLATLATHPEAAVALLRERLKPANGPDGADPAALAALIARLDGAGFADRERAAASLRWHGSDALPAVRERVNQPASPELKQRLTTLVDDIQAAPMPADRVRELRAVELLEQIGTAAARDQLKLLAGGAAGAALTRAAADALTRLPK